MKEVSSLYTVSLNYDRHLYKQDIAGSIAHARMLAKQEIIAHGESEAIVKGLREIEGEIESDNFPWRPELEDIHMNIERRLFEKIGDTAGRLHTARSRNDQIALDVRMFTKEVITEAIDDIHNLRKAFVRIADANASVIMPGYTHMQRAQPLLFAHHMLAYFEMLGRDSERFKQALNRVDVMPLGSGALAGLPYPIDREFVAKELGFSRISSNSMDAVSDRDFLIDFQAAAATCMMHISRLSEEIIIWSTDEFAFVRLSEDYTTGSSIMPQKRNPDFAEIARGKTGRVYGNLIGLLTLLKGLPLTYNRDLQEDKEGFFDTADTLLTTLRIFEDMISNMTINPERMREAAQGSYVLATDIADYLVARGMPFREAHGVVSDLSTYAVQKKVSFEEIPLEKYQQFSKLFDEEVFDITVDSSVAARNVPGGTAFAQVERAIAEAKLTLEADVE
jgi:argininosuccinate lyase